MADDIALVAYTKEELALLLEEFNQYCKDNLLTISMDKTLTLHVNFSKSQSEEADDPITINGSPILKQNFAQ